MELLSILNTIKKYTDAHPDWSSEKLKAEMLDKDSAIFARKWNDNFHNLFAYDDIINAKDENAKREAMHNFVLGTGYTDDGLLDLIEYENTAFAALAKAAGELINSLKGKNIKLFYSLTIKPDGMNYKVKEDINGKGGFNSDLFNRFYIRVIPEGPTWLGGLDILLGAQPTIVTKSTQPDVAEDLVKDVPPENNEEDLLANYDDFKSTLDNQIERETALINSDPNLDEDERNAEIEKLNNARLNLDIIDSITKTISIIPNLGIKDLSQTFEDNKELFSENDNSKEIVGKMLNLLGIKMSGLNSITATPAEIIVALLNDETIDPVAAKAILVLNKTLVDINPDHDKSLLINLAKQIKENYNEKC